MNRFLEKEKTDGDPKTTVRSNKHDVKAALVGSLYYTEPTTIIEKEGVNTSLGLEVREQQENFKILKIERHYSAIREGIIEQ